MKRSGRLITARCPRWRLNVKSKVPRRGRVRLARTASIDRYSAARFPESERESEREKEREGTLAVDLSHLDIITSLSPPLARPRAGSSRERRQPKARSGVEKNAPISGIKRASGRCGQARAQNRVYEISTALSRHFAILCSGAESPHRERRRC